MDLYRISNVKWCKINNKNIRIFLQSKADEHEIFIDGEVFNIERFFENLGKIQDEAKAESQKEINAIVKENVVHQERIITKKL